MRNSPLRGARRILTSLAVYGAMATAVHAAPITYELSGVADGSLGAIDFSDVFFGVTAVGDTSTTYWLAPGVPCIDTTLSTFTIEGVGSGTITTPISVAVNAAWQIVAIVHGRCADGGLMWLVGSNPSFGSYDLTTDLAMVALSMPSAPPGVTANTPQGTLVLHNVGALLLEAQLSAPAVAVVQSTNDANVVRTADDMSSGTVSNFQVLWYNAPAESESGWGINLAHQGDVIFATWFTYDLNGKAWWLSMSAEKTADKVYTGQLFETRGPAFNAVPFSPTAVSRTMVGSGTLNFSDANNGTFTYTVNGVNQTKTITRQVFGPSPTCVFGTQPNLALATNFQGLWYNAPAESESGWGINFAHQGDVIFATWFTYDFDSNPLWLSATAHKTAPRIYTGTLNRTTGPAFSSMPWNKNDVTLARVGTYTLTFADGNNGTFEYTVQGATQSKPIMRQVFRTPGTVCL